MITAQRILQTVSLLLFLALLYLAAYPLIGDVPVDLFLRLDPIVGLGTALAARQWSGLLWPGLLVLGATLFVGRVFCGFLCPMGTTIDVLDGVCSRGRKRTVGTDSYEAAGSYRGWKTLFLAVVFAASIGGASLVFIGSPLSLVTRLYGLVVHPMLLYLGYAGLDWSEAFLQRFPDLAYLDIQPRVFSTHGFVLLFFGALAALASVQPRFWCRNLCPSGALLALFSRWPLIRRRVAESCTECGRCIRACPTSAICTDPRSTVHSEFLVCLKCVDVCPVSAVSFTNGTTLGERFEGSTLPSRRQVLAAAGTGILTAGVFRTSSAQARPGGRERSVVHAELIRPPGALPEESFLRSCIRCGECMKACPTNTLQPVWLAAGWEGLFSPVMVPRVAACGIECNVCGSVCPTGAIRKLPLIEKQHAKVGTAWIDRHNCLVWAQDRKCLICDECCPYNAIFFRPTPERRNGVPEVAANKCTGCGWCENKCPVEGTSAIRVNVVGEVRLETGSYREKAAEYGFEFKAVDKDKDRLAPGTFDDPSVPGLPESAPSRPGEGLPEGFLDK